MFYKSNILNAFPIHSSAESKIGAVGGIPPPRPTGVDLYSRFAFAGAVCCSVTHGALTPVDVVKTRIQLEPEVYNKVCLSLLATFLVLLVASSNVGRNAANVRQRPPANFLLSIQTRALILQSFVHVTLHMPADAVSSVSFREWFLLSVRLSETRVQAHF